MLLAHAKAWHTYDQLFRNSQQGKVSISLLSHWGEPKTDQKVDIDAAERSMEWWLGWFAHPVFVNGDWPEVMKKSIKEKSAVKGIPNRSGIRHLFPSIFVQHNGVESINYYINFFRPFQFFRLVERILKDLFLMLFSNCCAISLRH